MKSVRYRTVGQGVRRCYGTNIGIKALMLTATLLTVKWVLHFIGLLLLSVQSVPWGMSLPAHVSIIYMYLVAVP